MLGAAPADKAKCVCARQQPTSLTNLLASARLRLAREGIPRLAHALKVEPTLSRRRRSHWPGRVAQVRQGRAPAVHLRAPRLPVNLSGPPSGRLSGLGVFHSKSTVCGAFLWARRALTSPFRRFSGPGSRQQTRQQRRPATLQEGLQVPPGRAASENSAHGGRRGGWRPCEKDAKLAQKLGQLQPFTAVFPQECMGQLASSGPT